MAMMAGRGGEGIVGGRWGRDSGDGQEMKERTKRGDGVRGVEKRGRGPINVNQTVQVLQTMAS